MQIVSHTANEMVINSIPRIDKSILSCLQRLSYTYTKTFHPLQLFKDYACLTSQKCFDKQGRERGYFHPWVFI